MIEKPRRYTPTLAERRAAMASVAEIAATSLQASARKLHEPAAEASHIVALAIERLHSFAEARNLKDPELAAIETMLLEARNVGHLTYLGQHGSENDFQSIGKKVAARFRTPGGKWRKLAGV